jgi:UDP-N-acetyl-2-amino-2-deoxyglucuronate dehydrogenase
MPEGIKVALLTHAGGAHVSSYLAALAETDQCTSVVLGDPDGHFEADAKRILKDKLSKTYRDVSELLRLEQPQMALVTMEAAIAPPVIAAALEAGCHVFAEKPSCVRAADFAPLATIADQKHRFLMLALANRLNPEVLAAKRLIETGRLGKLYGLEMHLVADQTRLKQKSYHQKWFAQKDRAGGGHLMWLAMHVTGSSIDSVAGFITNVGGQPIDVEDSAAASLKFDNGMLGTITSGYYLDRGYHSHIKVWGSSGWLHLESMKDEPLTWYSTKGEKPGQIQTWGGSKLPRGYTPFVQAAVKACAEMSEPPVSAAHSLRALKTVFAIYSSAQTGRMVVVDDQPVG